MPGDPQPIRHGGNRARLRLLVLPILLLGAMALSVSSAQAQAQDEAAPGRCRSGAAQKTQRLDKVLVAGEFRIRYAGAGADAPADRTDANGNGIPDAIDDLATQLLAAQALYSQVLGLTDPLRQPRYRLARAIDIEVMAMPEGNGLAFDEVGNSGGTGCALTIQVNRKLQPSGNITPAHELFHLYQYGYAMFKSRWYLEGMARWIESAFLGDAHLRPYLRGDGPVACEEVLGETYPAARYWRDAGRAMRGADVRIPAPLLARRYLDGRPVIAQADFAGGGFALPALRALQRASDEAARGDRLPLYNWPEEVQKSARFDAGMCRALESLR